MSVSRSEQLERFGMPIEEAREVLDRVASANIDRVAANKAWNDLSYELRGNKGQPHQCPRHPEAVRFKMVSEIADGRTIAEAVDAARAFAWTEA